MIQPKQLAGAAAEFVVRVALDPMHRRMQGGFQKTDVSIVCGWSGDDIVLKIKNIRGQIAGMEVAVPQKKIIVPKGVRG